MQACGSLLLTNQSTAKLSSDWLGGRYRREKIAWMIEPQVTYGRTTTLCNMRESCENEQLQQEGRWKWWKVGSDGRKKMSARACSENHSSSHRNTRG